MSLARRLVVSGQEDCPEVQIGFSLTVQIETITPEMAEEWLSTLPKIQRKKRRAHLLSIIEDIKAGRWRLNGETIIFNAEGQLIDGQHRLSACIEAGIPIVALVVRGVDPECYVTLDTSAKRTGAEALNGMVEAAKIVSSAALQLVRYQRGNLFKSKLSLSPSAIREVVASHPGLEASAIIGRKAVGVMKSAGVAAFCHYVFASKDQAAADEFFEKLTSGAGLQKGDPILTLRNRLLTHVRPDPDNLTLITFKSWNAWRKGTSLSLLKVGETEGIPKLI